MCRAEQALLLANDNSDQREASPQQDTILDGNASLQEEDAANLQRNNPQHFFVFIVGVCAQWDGRKTVGDDALYHAHLDVGIPEDQIVYLKDEDANKRNCVSSLSQLMQKSFPGSTLIFYYGGHGHASGFNTPGGTFRYREIITQIDSSFDGDRVLLLADCCASGNLARWIKTPASLKHSYVCLMSTQPYMEAGSEWCMTICWMNVLKSHVEISLAQLIAYMADETAISKGDCLSSFCRGEGASSTDCTWIPRSKFASPTKHVDYNKFQWKDPLKVLPAKAKLGANYSVGQRVYYRHPGGPLPGSEPAINVMPSWMQAYINQKPNNVKDTVSITVDDLIDKQTFVMTVPRTTLLSEWQMWTTWVVQDSFFDAQVAMAKKLKYFDYSVVPSTPVSVLWEDDGTVYDAKVMDWKDVDWGEYEEDEDISPNPPYGPHIVVRWDVDNKFSLVPLANVQSPSELRNSSIARDNGQIKITQYIQDQQRSCLIKSLETCGKKVIDGRKKFDSAVLSCPYPEDDEIYDAVAIGLESTSLETLASHASFTAVGEYCAIRYLEDDETQLIPVEYVSVKQEKCCLLGRLLNYCKR